MDRLLIEIWDTRHLPWQATKLINGKPEPVRSTTRSLHLDWRKAHDLIWVSDDAWGWDIRNDDRRGHCADKFDAKGRRIPVACHRMLATDLAEHLKFDPFKHGMPAIDSRLLVNEALISKDIWDMVQTLRAEAFRRGLLPRLKVLLLLDILTQQYNHAVYLQRVDAIIAEVLKRRKSDLPNLQRKLWERIWTYEGPESRLLTPWTPAELEYRATFSGRSLSSGVVSKDGPQPGESVHVIPHAKNKVETKGKTRKEPVWTRAVDHRTDKERAARTEEILERLQAESSGRLTITSKIEVQAGKVARLKEVLDNFTSRGTSVQHDAEFSAEARVDFRNLARTVQDDEWTKVTLDIEAKKVRARKFGKTLPDERNEHGEQTYRDNDPNQLFADLDMTLFDTEVQRLSDRMEMLGARTIPMPGEEDDPAWLTFTSAAPRQRIPVPGEKPLTKAERKDASIWRRRLRWNMTGRQAATN